MDSKNGSPERWPELDSRGLIDHQRASTGHHWAVARPVSSKIGQDGRTGDTADGLDWIKVSIGVVRFYKVHLGFL